MFGIDDPNRLTPGAHHNRLTPDHSPIKSHTMEQFAISDACGGEETVISFDEITCC
jgi:hypothetical protein